MTEGLDMITGLKRFALVGLLLLAGLLAACASSGHESSAGKPLPEMTFDHIVPLPLDVAKIDIENDYNPSADPKDVSSSLPTPPDILLRRYAEKKLSAAAKPGGSDERTLKFIIEDAHVYQQTIAPDNKMLKWLHMGGKERYDVFMRVRMYTVDAGGHQSTHSILNFTRYIAIPQNYSLAEKELEQFGFLEMLMKDADKAIEETLRDKMGLTL